MEQFGVNNYQFLSSVKTIQQFQLYENAHSGTAGMTIVLRYGVIFYRLSDESLTHIALCHMVHHYNFPSLVLVFFRNLLQGEGKQTSYDEQQL